MFKLVPDDTRLRDKRRKGCDWACGSFRVTLTGGALSLCSTITSSEFVVFIRCLLVSKATLRCRKCVCGPVLFSFLTLACAQYDEAEEHREAELV